jgi:hypothetical protein
MACSREARCSQRRWLLVPVPAWRGENSIKKMEGREILIKKQQHDPIFLAQMILLTPEHPTVGNRATVINKSITYAVHRNMASSYDYGEKGTAYTIQDQARSYLFS